MTDKTYRQDMFRSMITENGVERCVIVTGSFRAGTSFICSLLAKNGLPGIGKEKFNKFFPFRKTGSEAEFSDSLSKVFSTTQDGKFACKMMWPHRNNLAQSLRLNRSDSNEFASLFPNTKWINIVRKDKIGQAISFFRAKASNRWHIYGQEEEPEVEYDFSAIRKGLTELSVHDTLWQDFHRLAQTNVTHVFYEDFLEDVPQNLRDLTDFLGPECLGPGQEKLKLKSNLKMQRDSLSDSIRARFLEDCYSSSD